jgi:hypothetical protein
MPPSHGGASSTPLPQAELSLATDASDTHIGSVMQQKSGDHWRPLGFFFSKLTTPGSLDLPPPGVEYTMESQLPCDENARESTS